MPTIHRFRANDTELVARFLALRESFYHDDYYYYPETASHQFLINCYASRPDYRFELLLAEENGRDVARLVVGTAALWPFAFFGLFECAEDQDCFELLMTEASKVALELGAQELHGPIDFNGAHNWQFLATSITQERWVGDPYHRPYYLRLFEQAGWSIKERSQSGIMRQKESDHITDQTDLILEGMTAAGYRLVKLHEAPAQTLSRWAYDLVVEGFDPHLHCYMPLDFAVFDKLNQPLLEMMDDPFALMVVLHHEQPVGFALNYYNFIERLCNPDGKKPKPLGYKPLQKIFANKTIAVSKKERGGKVYPFMMSQMGKRMKEVYGHPGAWRRVNFKTPHVNLMFELSDIITQTYVSYSKHLTS